MDEQQQRPGAQGQASSQPGAQMQQGGASAQQGGAQPQQGAQQSQFSANAGQQGGGGAQGMGGQGAQPGANAEPPQASRGSGRYTDFLSGRGGSPLELLKRLDEDVDRLFHQFIGGGRELLRSRLRDRGGADATAGMPSAAGSSGGVDEAMTEAPGSMSSSTAMGSSPASGWLPQVELCERGGRLHVSMDLPGLHREDLQLHFDHGQLVVQGERRTTSTSAQPGGYYRSERSYGHFQRAIPLPEGVNPDTALASFHNGVLDVSFDMPVRHNRSRQIPIQDGAPGAGSGMSGATMGTSGTAGTSGAGSEAGA